MPRDQKLLKMKHPDIEGEGNTTRKAFDEVWQEKGWTLVEDDAPAAAPPVSGGSPAPKPPVKPEEE